MAHLLPQNQCLGVTIRCAHAGFGAPWQGAPWWMSCSVTKTARQELTAPVASRSPIDCLESLFGSIWLGHILSSSLTQPEGAEDVRWPPVAVVGKCGQCTRCKQYGLMRCKQSPRCDPGPGLQAESPSGECHANVHSCARHQTLRLLNKFPQCLLFSMTTDLERRPMYIFFSKPIQEFIVLTRGLTL